MLCSIAVPLRCTHFRLADFASSDERYHFATVNVTEQNAAGLHDHDYYEVFWANAGRGVHLINDLQLPFKVGQFWLIRAKDRHQVLAKKSDGLHVVNVAFSKTVWEKVRQRYFRDRPDPFKHQDTHWVREIDVSLQAELDRWARRLDTPARILRLIDGFIMELHAWLTPKESARVAAIPDWLVQARLQFKGPELLAGGTRAFAKIAGRSPSHVSRETLRFLGQTPTTLVNALRMDYLANLLTTTDRPIVDLSLDCGLNNLSHTYALFRKRFGMSPRRYRLRSRRSV